MILFTATIAVWITVLINKNEIARLEKRNQPMRSIARDLKVDDLTKYAVVKLDSLWMNDHRWDVYLPPGDYRVCIAMREVGFRGLPKTALTAKLSGGRHRLTLQFERKRDGCPIRLTADGTERIAFVETPEWGKSGSSVDHLTGLQSTQSSVEEALVLYQRQYKDEDNRGSGPETWKPGEGLILWIEGVKPTEPTSPQ